VSEVREIRGVLANIYPLEQMPPSEISDEQRDQWLSALKVYMTANYEPVYYDNVIWNSRSAAFVLTDQDRQRVENIMAGYSSPSADEIAEAERQLKDYRQFLRTRPAPLQQSSITTKARLEAKTFREFIVSSSSYGQPWFNFQLLLHLMTEWLALFWIPGLIAAFFGGGIIQRALKVGFVSRSGKQLSGLRAFWRAALPGLPAVVAFAYAYWVTLVLEISSYGPFGQTSAVFIVVGTFLLVATALSRRFISDYLAGSYLVPR
jgi:hypothetical protein